MTRTSIAIALLAGLAAAAPAAKARQTSPPATPNDYTKDANWLCRPGRQDACAVDLTTTTIDASGKRTVDRPRANPDAPIDCFYVYPTVSPELSTNADMTAGAAERAVVAQQFARFATVCRPYAPLYRQVTLIGLRRMLAAGTDLSLVRGLAYDDVANAWHSYLARDNHGRGVVLIGHSQGSFILMDLIRREIDGTPIQSRIVSAILAGTTLPVPRGKDVGGAFQHIPTCASESQTGCVIAFASFRATAPPPANSLFGRVATPGLQAACVDPADLDGSGGTLVPYFPSRQLGLAAQGSQLIDTPFVALPDLATSRCATNAYATYLEITVTAGRGDPRVHDIPGDLVELGRVQTQWGLHLADLNLTLHNLIAVVGAETRSFGKG